ncbi:MAG: histidinol dehydrogenase, partial [Thermoleophilia bacterium]
GGGGGGGGRGGGGGGAPGAPPRPPPPPPAELGLPTDRIAVVACRDRAAALTLVNAFAPEHLELHVTDAAALVPLVRSAGAIFVGPRAATAFGDYAAGTNHVLPTGGSARFGQGLTVSDFVKRVGVVEIDDAAAAGLAAAVATIADEEGLRAHARSARLRAAP